MTPQQARNILGGLALNDAGAAAPHATLHHERTGDHRAISEGEAGPTTSPASSIPNRIGQYRVLRLIAHGGMGAVYEAQQEHPHRRVAIKIMMAAALAHAHTREALRRFHSEVEILGRLEHPNIARLYDAGLHDDGFGGVPYFAMEYLPGARAITDFLREHDLSIQDRLDLFLQACDGVQHGHQRGIVHRDLKPGNILVAGDTTSEAADSSVPGFAGWSNPTNDQVDSTSPPDLNETRFSPTAAPNRRNAHDDKPNAQSASPRHKDVPARSPGPPNLKPQTCSVKVIDFGVARTTNADMTLVTQHTATGQFIGTLQYMSPEQCDGDSRELDTCSDVYSLGAVLYELLCERLPYDLSHMTISGAARIIQLDDPPPPQKWNRRLRGDIEAIILKAMHKNRDRRYGTAGELATDIRRHLNGEPVTARTPGNWMKATRWMGRHPITVTLSLCAAFIGLTVVSTLVSVYVLNSQPHRLEFSSDKQEVRLLARSGAEIRSWNSIARGSRCARMFNSIVDGQSRRLLALAITDSPNDPALNRSVALYDLDASVTKPIWNVSLRDEDLPEQARAKSLVAGNFHPGWIEVADIFPEIEGDEIIACFQSRRGECVLRIYGLSPSAQQSLCEFWHDGNMLFATWLPSSRRLVVAGLNAKAFWNERGHPEVLDHHHPSVVFSLTPRLNDPLQCWVTEDGGDGTISTHFYKALLPPKEALQLSFSNLPLADAPYDDGRHVTLAMLLNDASNCGWSMALDEGGNEVPGTRVMSNGWLVNPNVPDASVVHLGPLPGISRVNQ